MAEVKLTGGHVIEGDSVSLAGLARIIKYMRWVDLETFANEVEALRGAGENNTQAPLTAKHINEWASS